MGSDDSDGAGITLSYQFNDMAGMSLFWMRAENDNTTIDRGVGNAMDFVGLSVPLSGGRLSSTRGACTAISARTA